MCYQLYMYNDLMINQETHLSLMLVSMQVTFFLTSKCQLYLGFSHTADSKYRTLLITISYYRDYIYQNYSFANTTNMKYAHGGGKIYISKLLGVTPESEFMCRLLFYFFLISCFIVEFASNYIYNVPGNWHLSFVFMLENTVRRSEI